MMTVSPVYSEPILITCSANDERYTQTSPYNNRPLEVRVDSLKQQLAEFN